MRTTVTLDDDVARLLKQRARERDAPFKQVLNETIRAGLSSSPQPSEPYRLRARDLGVRQGIDLTSALGLAEALEDAELGRKLEQGR